MAFTSFAAEDFEVFDIPGLEPRMNALISRVRPKLTELGTEMAPVLSALCGVEMFPHVAKHARRTVHAPHDTWVAWGPNKRGYKALPHFQVGMFHSHLFIVFAIIYESDNKIVFAKALTGQISSIRKELPGNFFWSTDHLDPRGTPQADMSDEQFVELTRKLREVKKGEVTCGLRLDKNDPILEDGEALLNVIQETFETLLPLYRMSF
ncbi:DUF1054 domain-containing protein [Paenibacillus wynnii]|uniref:UPF0637 protein PWYN_18355 n=1 Tax=Paenibacillus wynnii TaxID=268407 RepID=A0A098M3R0_9BACL|nr:DUF1054 domain-containing protein [Paenibacillus wynnii]KGE16666.1 hypothetical protein PWYN_18355 [Paenibacillus wynnii]